MIKNLTLYHKKQVLDFCYKREKENLFVIGSFSNYKNTFEENKFLGFFENNNLVGIGVLFQRFGNYVINADSEELTKKLLDYAVKNNFQINHIAAFKKYTSIMVERLQNIHNKKFKIFRDETVFILDKKNFKNFSKGNEKIATAKNIDELVIFTTGKKCQEITEKDRKTIFPFQEFIIKKYGKIISKANTHGISKNYFQIGGVGTLEKYRNQGYAKQVVSKICDYYFAKGIKYGLLFTANNNLPALKLYKKIGFEPVDEFAIAEF